MVYPHLSDSIASTIDLMNTPCSSPLRLSHQSYLASVNIQLLFSIRAIVRVARIPKNHCLLPSFSSFKECPQSRDTNNMHSSNDGLG